MTGDQIKKVVRKGYGEIARTGSSCCAPLASCCGDPATAGNLSERIGYSEEELRSVPEGANLSLGCGNPTALATLREGETVLDLGSGAGIDCFLAAQRVGKSGKVIGVDMTPEMIDKARKNAERSNYDNVEFRLGEIENLPVDDNSVDVVISNCVINLSPDKEKVFREAYRVLRNGGRLMVSDIVRLEELPDFMKNSVEGYLVCISGAMMKDDYIGAMRAAGFHEVEIIEETPFPVELIANDPAAKTLIENLKMPAEKIREAGRSIVSIKVLGTKARA